MIFASLASTSCACSGERSEVVGLAECPLESWITAKEEAGDKTAEAATAACWLNRRREIVRLRAWSWGGCDRESDMGEAWSCILYPHVNENLRGSPIQEESERAGIGRT